MFISPVQLTTSRIGNLTRLILTLAMCVDIHAYKDKLCDTLRGMAPTNVKTVHQTSLLHTASNLERIGLLSPTHAASVLRNKVNKITLRSALINKPKFLKATSCRSKESSNTGFLWGGGLELLKPACEPASSRLKPCVSLKTAAGILPVRRSLLALVGRKQAVVRDRRSPHKPPGSRL